MDEQQFDDLTRLLAGRSDPLGRRLGRRGLLAGLAAATLGMTLGRSDQAEAACPPEQIKRRGMGCVCKKTGRPPGAAGCIPCPTGLTRCGGECVDLSRDPDHCGACGVECEAGFFVDEVTCRQGVCAIERCVPGFADCDDDPDTGCETPLGTTTDCVACGDSCESGEICGYIDTSLVCAPPTQWVCVPGSNHCATAAVVFCDNLYTCICIPSVEGSTFCGYTGALQCAACTTDAQCVGVTGPNSKCVSLQGCADCPDTASMACMAPCPVGL